MDTESSPKDNIPRSRQLILTLKHEQRVQGNQIDHLRNRFAEFNYHVKIRSAGINSNLYEVVFKDDETAKRAYHETETIGYKLAKKHGQRPTPNNMVKFLALSELTIRSGKSLSKRVVGRVKKNDVVIVNRVKGRRARMVIHNNGQMFEVGWVSLRSANGVALLKRLEEKYEKQKLF